MVCLRMNENSEGGGGGGGGGLEAAKKNGLLRQSKKRIYNYRFSEQKSQQNQKFRYIILIREYK
jgi:hypothetical protein